MEESVHLYVTDTLPPALAGNRTLVAQPRTSNYEPFVVRELMKFNVVVLRVVTSCSVVVGYRRFGGPCRFHLQGSQPRKHRFEVILVLRAAHVGPMCKFRKYRLWSYYSKSQIIL